MFLKILFLVSSVKVLIVSQTNIICLRYIGLLYNWQYVIRIFYNIFSVHFNSKKYLLETRVKCRLDVKVIVSTEKTFIIRRNAHSYHCRNLECKFSPRYYSIIMVNFVTCAYKRQTANHLSTAKIDRWTFWAMNPLPAEANL